MKSDRIQQMKRLLGQGKIRIPYDTCDHTVDAMAYAIRYCGDLRHGAIDTEGYEVVDETALQRLAVRD